MPSLITTRAPQTQAPAGASRMLSKVNSFKREWGSDDGPVAGPSTSQPADWSPSPERVARKAVVKARAPSPTPMQDPFETAADRRRKAILAAMAGVQNTAPPASSATAMPDNRMANGYLSGSNGSSSSRATASSVSAVSDIVRRAPLQELPSLPDMGMNVGVEKKRAMPWEADKPGKRPARSTSNKSTDSVAPPMNIRQKISLSTEQQKVLTLVVQQEKNIFFTGSAGTGKSVLLREIIKNLRKKYVSAPDAVAVTASTGIAACNIGGVTMHSFGGAGLCLESVDVLVGKIRKNKKAAARWVRTKVLIIDEVSMVDGELFDKFCKIGQKLRKNEKPFGGIQIIVTGDFFQLPPVTKGGAVPRFCFEAMTWEESIHMSVNLTKVFRQKDETFVDMLNEMRFGKLSPTSTARFKALARPVYYNDGIEPTELFPRREDVERSNHTRLSALNTDGWSYAATDGGVITDPVQRDKALSNFMAVAHLMIKVDAQVMLIKNVDETLVNGSMGKVVGFCHKQLYVTDTQGRWQPDGDIDGLDEGEREKKERMRDMIMTKIQPGTKPYPVVQFKVPGGGVRDMLVEHDVFKSELPNGEVQVSRSQLPLILAWAMSIHKSQGQTLDRVKVDLGKVFEKGQAYVALSRATSMEGLQVMGFSADKVQAHRKVAVWSQNLKNLNTD